MCGIALILSGVDVLGSNLYREYDGTPSSEVNEVSKISQPTLVVEDLKSAIGRRGPDNIGFKKIFLRSQKRNGPGEDDVEEYLEEGPCVRLEENKNGNLSSRFEDAKLEDGDSNGAPAELYFIGATLQLRGVGPICQPLVDSCGNVLVFNGEIFGGIHVCDDRNDAETLLQVLESCCHCNNDVNEKVCSCTIQSIPEIISLIRGPWALVYWQKKSRTLWFGRDAFGRRSILVHWPTLGDSRFVLSSVSPASTIRKSSGFIVPDVDTDVGHPTSSDCYWEELPCGVYSIQFKASESSELLVKGKLIAEVRKHKWTDPLLNRLIEWERKYVDPTTGHCFSKDPQLRMDLLVFPSVTPNGIQQDVADVGNVGMQQEEDTLDTHNDLPGDTGPVEKLLSALRESVRRQTVNNIFKTFQQEDEMDDHAPIAILFSGGLDSMILSAILDQCLDPRCTIDLLNVSFDAQLAPDRVSARIGLAELQRVAPSRRWRLVEIDATLSNLTWETEHLISLIHPAQTYMDLNIGIALWLAAGGDGWVDGRLCNSQQSNPRCRYKSTARILLVGSGADEQCAGYGRHRTKYRLGGWVALHEEMRLDMQRIWKRNMGRDDRCISDHGKEARFPFLDEDVVQTLLNFPLWDIAVLDKPSGIGDKKILREVARLLGLEQAASLPKRAIQFGSRIARESNRKNFGSNRAANQASAGSVVIHQSLQ